MTKACKETVHRKHTKWLEYQYCKTELNYDAYKVARNAATLQLRKSKYSYEKDITTRIKTENKLFWSNVRNNTKTKSSVEKLMKPSGEACKSDQETANVLNNYFASVFETEDNQLQELSRTRILKRALGF